MGPGLREPSRRTRSGTSIIGANGRSRERSDRGLVSKAIHGWRVGQAQAIDLRKLRDAQKPDSKAIESRLRPATAVFSGTAWTTCPVMGRLVVLQRHGSMASGCDCYVCDCPADYVHLDVVPLRL